MLHSALITSSTFQRISGSGLSRNSKPFSRIRPLNTKGFLVLVAITALLLSDNVRGGDLMNLSSRGSVGTVDNVLIGGVIVTGNSPKRVIFRALGGSLTSNGTPVAGTLEDPILDLRDSSGQLLQNNDDWRYGPELEIEASQLAPTNDYESVVIATLAPANYTAIIFGYAHSSGIATVEAYDPDPASGSRLAEISTRGNVQTGDQLLIGGFIVANGATKVLLRAIGPELTAFKVPNALQNTTLELRDDNGALLNANDDWKTDNQQAISDTGAPPKDDRESAIVSTVNPGRYTALVRGKGNTTGIALVEIYRLP